MVTQDGRNVPKPAGEKSSSHSEVQDNTLAMLIMAGVVVSSAGFTMYTKQADSLLRRMNSGNKIQGIAKSSAKVQKQSRLIAKPERKIEAKTYHGKDDSFL
mmetsp:Transcript_24779/g.58156  ORF Transcript_24779/g.58156 Transcript_24779/m.58156 type:complete len:101 (-) Transcript_24779:357-659(-)